MTFARGFRGLFASVLFAAGQSSDASAQVTTNIVNNGSSTDGLVRIQNANGTAEAEMGLSLQDPPPGLVAAQTPTYSDFPVIGAWYSQSSAAADKDYAVAVAAQPAGNTPDCRIGVMGWLDATVGRGVSFRVVPSADSGAFQTFQVSVVDFNATTEAENDSVTNLFNLDGSRATTEVGSALAAWGDYTSDQPANFVLQFSTPSAADVTALSTATAHITAKVFQSPPGGADPVQVGSTIELLTDLPAPTAQRFGYLASWGTSLVPGEPVGIFTNLALLGNLVVLHRPPVVTITSPTNGAEFSLPANLTLSAAASAFDGATITTVQFFQGNAPVGTVANPPYSIPVSIAAAGSYTLTAVATDSQGTTTTSAAVTIQVTGGASGQAARLTNAQALPSPSDFRTFEFTVAGTPGATYVTEATGNYVAWTPLATNQLAGPNATVTIARGTANFVAFRARTDAGGPPASDVVIINPQALPSTSDFQTFAFKVMGLAGKTYRVEATSDWLAWSPVKNGTGTGAVEDFAFPRSGAALFYRVIVP